MEQMDVSSIPLSEYGRFFVTERIMHKQEEGFEFYRWQHNFRSGSYFFPLGISDMFYYAEERSAHWVKHYPFTYVSSGDEGKKIVNYEHRGVSTFFQKQVLEDISYIREVDYIVHDLASTSDERKAQLMRLDLMDNMTSSGSLNVPFKEYYSKTAAYLCSRENVSVSGFTGSYTTDSTMQQPYVFTPVCNVGDGTSQKLL